MGGWTLLALTIILTTLNIDNVLSCTVCEWGEWTQIAPCTPGCGGSQMRVRRLPCCPDGEGERACAQRCGISVNDMYRYDPCTAARPGYSLLSKRSIGSGATKCVPVDLMFVMDESGSISSTNFQKMLVFAEDLISELNIGTDEAMIAFLTYSGSTTVHFRFNSYSTKSQVISKIRTIGYQGGGTDTADALTTARQYFSSTHGKRDNALSLAIVLTDGMSNNKPATMNAAYALHNHGVSVYCIGIGSNLDADELKAIASNPNDHYLISSSDFDALTDKITGLVKSLCINDVIPTFMTCHMEIQDDYGEIAQSTHTPGSSSECKNQLDFYGKYQVHRAITTMEVDADLSGLTAPTNSEDFAYGMTDAKVEMIKKSISGYETKLGEGIVKSDPNILQKPDQLLSKDLNMTVSHTLVNGDRFCLRYIADASGYVQYQGRKYTYAKTRSSHDLCYYYDNVAPRHCKDIGTCTDEPLVLSKEITREKDITVTFSGWTDTYPPGSSPVFASDIKSYELYLYEMIDGALGKLKMDTTSLINKTQCTCPQKTISLPESSHPALYAVVLEVVDIALNVRYARRFVFRDNVSEIAVHPHNPFQSSSATNVTDYEWQINNGDVCFQWKDRYYNDKMIHFNPLNPIEPDPHGHFLGIYEQINGAIPAAGTPNVHGITDFVYSLYRDGIRIQMNQTVPNFLSQSICLSPATTGILDGHTFMLQLYMSDLVLHDYVENSTVHIDASVAEIEDMWLTKNGRHQLFIHDHTDLTTMTLIFTALDIHSGLHSVQWWIGTSDDNVHFGHGALGVHRLNESEPCPLGDANCYCPAVGVCEYSNFSINLNSLIANNTHIGLHNRRYFMETKVTNNARLEVVEKVEILVDESPPETGVVIEGPQGSPDIDYTGQLDLLISWTGFIDHESGIRFYHVGVSESCLSVDNMTSALIFKELTSSETDTTVTLPGVGKYFATVVAYNNAIMPSQPVCSDGIIVDTTPSIITNISLNNARFPRSSGCFDGLPWLLGPRGTRMQVNESICNIDCANRKNSSLLKLLPEQHESDVTMTSDCTRLLKFEDVYIYVPTDDIHLFWNISEEESQIARAYVGFGSSPSTVSSPDIMGYEEAKHSLFFKKHHAGLTNGDLFYIFTMVVNKANIESKAVFGPVILDESRPTCSQKPVVTVTVENVTIRWDSTVFSDQEQLLDIGIIHHRVGFSGEYITPFSTWHIEKNPQQCKTANQYCITYNTTELQNAHRESESPLFVNFQAESYAGYHCSINTDSFVLPSLHLPSKGVVLDVIDPASLTSKMSIHDVDYTNTPYKICAHWEGFHHKEDLHFMVAVGTAPQREDVLPFTNASNENWHCFTDNVLKPYTKYYTTVKISNSAGSIAESTDGVVIIDVNTFDFFLEVHDGSDCDVVAPIETENISMILDSSSCHEFHIETLLHVGQQYTMTFHPQNNDFQIQSDDVIVGKSGTFIKELIITPMVNYPYISLCNPGNSSVFVDFVQTRQCVNNVDYTASQGNLEAHWLINETLLEHVSHFEVSIIRHCNGGQCNNEIAESSVFDRSLQVSFPNIDLREGNYSFIVRTCFGEFCTTGRNSNGFYYQTEKPRSGFLSANIDNIGIQCQDIEVNFESFVCSSSDSVLFYKWFVANDAVGSSVISEPVNVKSDPSSVDVKQDSECLQLPIHPHKPSFVCLEGYCPSGLSTMTCVPLTTSVHPNDFRKDVVYDLDGNSDIIDEIEEFKHSLNIGFRLKDIANAELDVSGTSVSISGFILGAGERNITWYLMEDAHIPTGECSDDRECLLSLTTYGGVVTFKKTSLQEGVIYYTCAHSAAVTINHELVSVDLPSITMCSDGVLIDDTPPSKGTVTVHTDMPGYITTNTVAISWTDFTDNTRYISLGYPSPIARYEYALGSRADTDDIVPFTSAGLSEGVIAYNVRLLQGFTYFAQVKAFDHNGNFVRASSSPVAFDASPPIVGKIAVGISTNHQLYMTGHNIPVHISGFHDDESGVMFTELGIGSTPNITDVVKMTTVEGNAISIQNKGEFVDGHLYYVFVVAKNNAGLFSRTVPEAFVYDGSPPIGGTVRDGRAEDSIDINYSVNRSVLACHWTEFYDPHSHIQSYSVALGTEPGGTDVVSFVEVGLRKSWTWRHPIKQGVKHYCTVKACNNAELCTLTSSDGATIDGSAPVVGLVHVGRSGKHSKYIASRSFLEVQWLGFEDPQSEIRHFETCIGTTKGSCNVVPYVNTGFKTYHTFSGISLPSNTPLFVTVKARNNAGMESQTSSDSFVVDDTAPVVIRNPKFLLNVTDVSKYDRYQWDPSQISLFWEYKDDESSVTNQYVTLRTHDEGHTDIGNFKLASEKHLHMTLPSDSLLREGDTYFADVTACNPAGLCSSITSPGLLVDHTPPHVGEFRFPLTWNNGNQTVDLAWQNFIDAESGIRSYHVGVGETYSGLELTGTMIEISHVGNASAPQTSTLYLTRSLSHGERLVLSVVAENNVGLTTSLARTTVEVVSTNPSHTVGTLNHIKHSCDAAYCNKDCTCATVGNKCVHIISNSSCVELSGYLPLLPEFDVRFGLRSTHQEYSSSISCLSANWELASNGPNKDIKRYEWSFGIYNMTIGSGVFDLTEPIWYDKGLDTSVVHCLPQGRYLAHKQKYVAYLTVWFSSTESAQYSSLPVLVDTTPPSVRRGKFVKDSDPTCSKDIEYIVSTDTVTACWDDVFADGQSGISKYKVFLGTHPAADDVILPFDANLSTKKTFTGLSLTPGTKYYFTVEAESGVGIKTLYSSDGFTVDNAKPITGIVYTTDNFHDISWVSSSTTVSVSWHGFLDLHSYIKEYQVALAEDDSTGSIVSDFQDAEMHNTFTISDLNLQHGKQYVVLVKAVDAANHESDVVSSEPFRVDLSQPKAFKCASEVNVITSQVLVNGSLQWEKKNIAIERGFYYKVNLLVRDIDDQAVVVLHLNETFQTLSRKRLHDESFSFDFTFHSEVGHVVDMALIADNICPDNSCAANIIMTKCTPQETSDVEAIVLHQVSSSQISVEVRVRDEESDVKSMLVGVGTTPKAFQVRSFLTATSMNHILVDVDRPHATPLYATVIAENHAGQKSNFSTPIPLMLDHTPPSINNPVVTIRYDRPGPSGSYIVSMEVSFDPSDTESSIYICSCALGREKGADNLQQWTNVQDINSAFISAQIEAYHGMVIHTSIACANTAELKSITHADPEIVSYETPTAANSSVAFAVNSVRLRDQSATQATRTSLNFYWDFFHDASGIRTYKCRIRSNQTMVSDWTETQLHNYISFDDLDLIDRNRYTAEVIATNVGGQNSDVISSEIHVNEILPILTGNLTVITPSGVPTTRVLSWNMIFDLDPELLPSFIVSVGTAEGHSDIARSVHTDQLELDLSIDNTVTNQYITLRTHDEGHTNIDNVKLASEKHLHMTLSSDSLLREGDTYFADVTACNPAGLCSTITSPGLLVDHTPPHVGEFRFPLTWNNDNQTVDLAWQNFIDAESGICSYHVGVGETYSGLELTGTMIEISHVGNASAPQTSTLYLTRSLSHGERLVLSVVAENNVGLKTSLARTTVEVVSTNPSHTVGTLNHIKHSCDAAYCNKDCTCATVGNKCVYIISNSSCVELSGSPPLLPEFDVRFGLRSTHQEYSSSISCLSANWELVSNGPNKDIKPCNTKATIRPP